MWGMKINGGSSGSFQFPVCVNNWMDSGLTETTAIFSFQNAIMRWNFTRPDELPWSIRTTHLAKSLSFLASAAK